MSEFKKLSVVVNRQIKMEKDNINPELNRKMTAFEQVINRLSQIEQNHGRLARMCHEKSMRIDNTGEQIKTSEEKDMPESVINILHRIANRMEENNLILDHVLSDLENAIP